MACRQALTGLVAALALWTWAGTFAADRPVRGDVSATLGHGLGGEGTVLSRLETNLRAGRDWNDCAARLALRLRLQRHLTADETGELEAREADVTCRREAWSVTAGVQSVVWGKADGFRVLDAVHPFDYREFILDERESARIPLAMVRAERRVGEEDTLQALVIPQRERDRLPNLGDRFAPPWPQLLYDEYARDGGREDGWTLDDMQAGLKWEHTGQRLGYTLNLLNRWSPLPYYEYSPAAGAILRQDYRQWLAGGSFDLSVSDWVLRGEAVYLPEVHLQQGTRGLPPPGAPVPDYADYGQLSWVLGADRFAGDWFLSAQLFETRALGNDLAPVTGRTQHAATFLTTRGFLQGRAELRAFAARDLSERGSWINLSIAYEPTAHLELRLSADFLAGTTASAFGRIADQDRLLLTCRVRF